MAVKSIREIKEEFKQIPPEKLPEYMDLYRDDSRKGVQDFLKTQENRMKKYEAELVRIEELCSFEKKYSDYSYIYARYGRYFMWSYNQHSCSGCCTTNTKTVRRINKWSCTELCCNIPVRCRWGYSGYYCSKEAFRSAR